MQTRLFIVDTGSPGYYHAGSLLDEGSGGTVAAVIGLQHALDRDFDVYVVQQHGRSEGCFIDVGELEGVIAAGDTPFAFIHVRSAPGVLDLASLVANFPGVPVVHWQHITMWQHSALAALFDRRKRRYNRRLGGLLRFCGDNGIPIVGTSAFHESNMREVMPRFIEGRAPSLGWTYNPVLTTELFAASPGYDPDLMLFASNPKRGLARALRQFEAIHAHWPQMRLQVAAPSYAVPSGAAGAAGVEMLGSLTRRQLWQLMDSAFALFYPNLEEPECFGYVFAEANALGCPVITQDAGAAREVLVDADQLVDCEDTDAILACIERWREGARPGVSVNPEVLPVAVAESWSQRIGRMVHA